MYADDKINVHVLIWNYQISGKMGAYIKWVNFQEVNDNQSKRY